MITHEIKADLAQRGCDEIIHLTQGDTASHQLRFRITKNHRRWKPPKGLQVLVHYSNIYGSGGTYDSLVDDTPAWSIAEQDLCVMLVPEAMALPGSVHVVVTLLFGGEALSAFHIRLMVDGLASASSPVLTNYSNITDFLPRPGTAEEGQFFAAETVTDTGKVLTVKAADAPSDGSTVPTVTVTPTADGAKITITDKGGTTTATITDGQDGTTPHIGSNGNWFLGATDTGTKAAGADGKDGLPGKDGMDGQPGDDGKSAYQYAREGGYTGTEEEFAAKLSADTPLPDFSAAQDQPGHILGRTHWSEFTPSGEILSETVFSWNFETEEDFPIVMLSEPLIPGNAYQIIWNGTQYICNCIDYNGIPFIGDLRVFDMSYDYNGIPFAMVGEAEECIVLPSEAIIAGGMTGSASISVTKGTELVIPLPEKYLKQTVPFYIPISYENYEVVTSADPYAVMQAIDIGRPVIAVIEDYFGGKPTYAFLVCQYKEDLHFITFDAGGTGTMLMLELHPEGDQYSIRSGRYSIDDPYALTVGSVEYNGRSSGPVDLTETINEMIEAKSYTHPETHDAEMITGLSKVAASGSYSDLSNTPAALKNPCALTINGSVYDGSAPVEVSISGGSESGEPVLSDNLFDKSAAIFGKGWYHSSSGATLIDSDDCYYAYVQLRGAGVYRTKVNISFHGEAYAQRVPLMKADKTWLQNISGTLTETGDRTAWDLEFTVTQEMIDAGAAYYTLTIAKSNIDTVMMVKDRAYPEAYIPYGYTSGGVSGEAATVNSLRGKTALFLGDSLCAGTSVGEDSEFYGYGWGGLIGSANGMIWKNYGRNGGTVTALSDVDPSRWLCTQADSALQEHPQADYILFEGGCNDADRMGDTGLGVITSGYGVFEETTFSGAFESLILQLVTAFPQARIGYIIPPKMYAQNDHTAAGHIHRRYFDRAATLCEKWGIPCLDLWNCCPLNPSLPTAELFYTDGQHLTLEGYRRITSQTDAFLRSL